MIIQWEYMRETETSRLLYKEEPLQSSNLYQYLQQPIEQSASPILSELVNLLNDDEWTVHFSGDFDAYHFIQRQIQREPTFNNITIQKTNELTSNIHYVREQMNETPFQSWRTPSIQSDVDQLEQVHASIYVLATMSAGKSTVLNAMIGKELVPTDHLASTSKFIHLVDHPSQERNGWASNESGTIEKEKHLSLETIQRWNADPSVKQMTIETPLFLGKASMGITLIDTPGPNNYQDARHKEEIQRFIEQEEHPFLLYVLDVEKIGTDDDANYLKTLQTWFEQSGKNLGDRTFFIVNKVDVLPSSEDVERSLQHIRSFLKGLGIGPVRLFPVSAHFGLLARLKQRGETLRPRDEKLLALYSEELEKLQLLDYCPLEPFEKETLRMTYDSLLPDERDVFVTGIPIVERAIVQLLEREALQTQLRDLLERLQQEAKNELESAGRECARVSYERTQLPKLEHEDVYWKALMEKSIAYKRDVDQTFEKIIDALQSTKRFVNYLPNTQQALYYRSWKDAQHMQQFCANDIQLVVKPPNDTGFSEITDLALQPPQDFFRVFQRKLEEAHHQLKELDERVNFKISEQFPYDVFLHDVLETLVSLMNSASAWRDVNYVYNYQLQDFITTPLDYIIQQLLPVREKIEEISSQSYIHQLIDPHHVAEARRNDREVKEALQTYEKEERAYRQQIEHMQQALQTFVERIEQQFQL
ncbi:hypothetical protein GOP80_07555 [Planococcaceae bacterium Storch 2/2-2]|nr:hypothetical protein [Planococcaceae bacterium Storch 2/2-2]